MPCKYITWFYLNENTGETKPFKCGSWHCADHRQSLAWKWAFKVARAAPERMVTLTNIPKDRQEALYAFQHLIRDLRERGPFEYVRFFEVGSKTGMYHYHLGQRGEFVPQRLLSSMAAKNGLGRVVDIRKCHGKGPGWYMSKYIAKGLDDIPAGWRKVAASKGFWPTVEASEEPEQGWMLVPGRGALKRLSAPFPHGGGLVEQQHPQEEQLLPPARG